MGIYDRGYYQDEPRPGYNSFANWPWCYRLIAFCVAIFLLDNIMVDPAAQGVGPISKFALFVPGLAVQGMQVWRFITYLFVHPSLGSIFFDMLFIFFFGRMLEQELGPRRFLAVFLISGLTVSIAAALIGLGTGRPDMFLASSDGASLGIIIAAAMIAPDSTVLFSFLIPMPFKVLALISVGLCAFGALTGDLISLAHLAGAPVGYLLITNRHWLNFVDRIPTISASRSVRPSVPGSSPWNLSTMLGSKPVTDDEVDRLLDKVHQHGIESLTSAEKASLKRASRQRRNKPNAF